VTGTAILKPGQYRRSEAIGKHRGPYDALTQVRPVSVFRDPNRDEVLDDGGFEETGLFGINIHRANPSRESVQVDKCSAGCQVIADPVEFDVFISLCRAAGQVWGNHFTYTPLEEADIV